MLIRAVLGKTLKSRGFHILSHRSKCCREDSLFGEPGKMQLKDADEGWGTAQLVKRLLCKHGDLSSTLRSHAKKPGVIVGTYNASSGNVETGSSLGFPIG